MDTLPPVCMDAYVGGGTHINDRKHVEGEEPWTATRAAPTHSKGQTGAYPGAINTDDDDNVSCNNGEVMH